MDLINLVLNYAIIPAVAFIAMLYDKLNKHSTQLAVLTSLTESNKQSHEREMNEIHGTMGSILAKLTSIEEYMRK